MSSAASKKQKQDRALAPDVRFQMEKERQAEVTEIKTKKADQEAMIEAKLKKKTPRADWTEEQDAVLVRLFSDELKFNFLFIRACVVIGMEFQIIPVWNSHTLSRIYYRRAIIVRR